MNSGGLIMNVSFQQEKMKSPIGYHCLNYLNLNPKNNFMENISENPTKVIRAMEEFASLKTKDFEAVVRPVMQYLCENHHPHVIVIITSTNAELLEAKKSTGQIMDYVID